MTRLVFHLGNSTTALESWHMGTSECIKSKQVYLIYFVDHLLDHVDVAL